MRRRCRREWLLYACRRSVEAAESEIELEVASLLHHCCIAVDEESGVDLQCLSVLLKAMQRLNDRNGERSGSELEEGSELAN